MENSYLGFLLDFLDILKMVTLPHPEMKILRKSKMGVHSIREKSPFRLKCGCRPSDIDWDVILMPLICHSG